MTNKLFAQTKSKKFRDIMVEHDFTANLLRGFIDSKIVYEILREPPPSSIDLKIECANAIFWIQIKALSESERSNRQNIIINKIESICQNIYVGKYFDIELSEDFSETNIDDICNYIRDKAVLSNEGVKYNYRSTITNDEAEVSFSNIRHDSLDHLTLRSSGDMGLVESTGLTKEQIKKSFTKAAENFSWDSNVNVINLIMIEIKWAFDGSHISEELYGTEADYFKRDPRGKFRPYRIRKDDGLFLNESFSSKISGLIVRLKKGYNLHKGYWQCLYINEKYIQNSELITSVIKVDKVVRSTDFTGGNFFDLDKK
jgi:hypothetical protein